MKHFIFGVKKITLALGATLLISNNAFADDVLTGDTRLACEAILCLSSGTRPGECSSSLARYFSIKFKKPWKTVNARRAFLNLCPVQNDANIEDLVLNNLVDDVLPASDPRQCTPEYLNTQVEQSNNTYLDELLGNRSYRIKTTMPNFCYSLINHEYTDYKTPKYKCSGEFYSALEWRLSARLELVNWQEYQSLNDSQRYAISRSCGDNTCYTYFKKTPFSKICWTY
ncbi:TrbM/KikA/MpfK family conjugal transfer protein [Campylobacter coli]|uniref:TrbM/KikA/MpfK family conjugal transfer protein n=1 Tax=Campylobacter coli TaxID=195 RepID=UPI000707323B|nr:TrbM/KikA/MpfK family conjugal transfer protein [Campylobacter coli]KQH96170.1 TrbM protein [Campylobacter coli CVM 41932]